MDTKVLDRILELAYLKFKGDADFEAALGVPAKTVGNWKRGSSSSFYKMLPQICDLLGTTPNHLLDYSTAEYGGEEMELVIAYRTKVSGLPSAERHAVVKAVKAVISLAGKK